MIPRTPSTRDGEYMFESLEAGLGVRTGRRPGTAVAVAGGDAVGGMNVSGNGAGAGGSCSGTKGAEKKPKKKKKPYNQDMSSLSHRAMKAKS